MARELDKLRKRLALRRREINERTQKSERMVPLMFQRHEEAREEPEVYVYPERNEPRASTDRQGLLLFRTLISICLFLVIAIVFQTNAAPLQPLRAGVEQAFEQEFQFAAIAHWYEQQFGQPLALIPSNDQFALGDPDQDEERMVFAVPASGVITESFEQNGRGVLVETGVGAEVEAAKSGYVIEINNSEEGKMVTLQHYDGSESIYGMIDNVAVNVYDHIEAGTKIGTASRAEDGEKGVYYFALKQGENYVDPSDVIRFD